MEASNHKFQFEFDGKKYSAFFSYGLDDAERICTRCNIEGEESANRDQAHYDTTKHPNDKLDSAIGREKSLTGALQEFAPKDQMLRAAAWEAFREAEVGFAADHEALIESMSQIMQHRSFAEDAAMLLSDADAQDDRIKDNALSVCRWAYANGASKDSIDGLTAGTIAALTARHAFSQALSANLKEILLLPQEVNLHPDVLAGIKSKLKSIQEEEL